MPELKQPQEAAKTTTEQPLTTKKKRAMLEYMAIMFAAAFLLVAISLLIKVIDIKRSDSAFIRLVGRLRKIIRGIETLLVALLRTDELGKRGDFVIADKRALRTDHIGPGIVNHIALADQLFSACRVENSLGIGT